MIYINNIITLGVVLLFQKAASLSNYQTNNIDKYYTISGLNIFETTEIENYEKSMARKELSNIIDEIKNLVIEDFNNFKPKDMNRRVFNQSDFGRDFVEINEINRRKIAVMLYNAYFLLPPLEYERQEYFKNLQSTEYFDCYTRILQILSDKTDKELEIIDFIRYMNSCHGFLINQVNQVNQINQKQSVMLSYDAVSFYSVKEIIECAENNKTYTPLIICKNKKTDFIEFNDGRDTENIYHAKLGIRTTTFKYSLYSDKKILFLPKEVLFLEKWVLLSLNFHKYFISYIKDIYPPLKEISDLWCSQYFNTVNNCTLTTRIEAKIIRLKVFSFYITSLLIPDANKNVIEAINLVKNIFCEDSFIGMQNDSVIKIENILTTILKIGAC